MPATKSGLFEDETQTGTVSAGPSHRLKGITADLPDDLFREAHLFIM